MKVLQTILLSLALAVPLYSEDLSGIMLNQEILDYGKKQETGMWCWAACIETLFRYNRHDGESWISQIDIAKQAFNYGGLVQHNPPFLPCPHGDDNMHKRCVADLLLYFSNELKNSLPEHDDIDITYGYTEGRLGPVENFQPHPFCTLNEIRHGDLLLAFVEHSSGHHYVIINGINWDQTNLGNSKIYYWNPACDIPHYQFIEKFDSFRKTWLRWIRVCSINTKFDPYQTYRTQNYPSNYLDNTDHKYLLSPGRDSDYYIVVNGRCETRYDNLYIKEMDGTIIETITGAKDNYMLHIENNRNVMVHFVSDNSVTDIGFKVTLRVPEYQTPNYPSNYPNFANETVTITNQFTGAYSVVINGRCESGYDNLYIRELNGTIIATITGLQNDRKIYIDNNRDVKVQFVSDYSVTDMGFIVTLE